MRQKIGIGLVALFGLLALGIILFAKDFTVTIPETQVQAKIDEKINQGPVKTRLVELSFRTITIDFKANDTAALNVDFSAEGLGYSGDLSGNFAAGIRYNDPKIFLDNIVPASFDFTPGAKARKELEDIKTVAADYLKRKQNEMLTEKAKTALGDLAQGQTEKLKAAATEMTYKYFEILPVYNLHDAGIVGSLANLALKDVQFTEDSAIVTLSPVKALLKILSFIAFFLLISGGLWIYFIPDLRRRNLGA